MFTGKVVSVPPNTTVEVTDGISTDQRMTLIIRLAAGTASGLGVDVGGSNVGSVGGYRLIDDHNELRLDCRGESVYARSNSGSTTVVLEFLAFSI